jgi:hypothetical protein
MWPTADGQAAWAGLQPLKGSNRRSTSQLWLYREVDQKRLDIDLTEFPRVAPFMESNKTSNPVNVDFSVWWL